MNKILTGEWDGEPILRDAFPSDNGRVLWKDTEFVLADSHDCKLADKGFCECKKEPEDFSTSDNGTGEIIE